MRCDPAARTSATASETSGARGAGSAAGSSSRGASAYFSAISRTTDAAAAAGEVGLRSPFGPVNIGRFRDMGEVYPPSSRAVKTCTEPSPRADYGDPKTLTPDTPLNPERLLREVDEDPQKRVLAARPSARW